MVDEIKVMDIMSELIVRLVYAVDEMKECETPQFIVEDFDIALEHLIDAEALVHEYWLGLAQL